MKILNFFFVIFKEILPKLSDFIYSSNCIGKLTSKPIRLQPVFIKKKFEVYKNNFFLVKQ